MSALLDHTVIALSRISSPIDRLRIARQMLDRSFGLRGGAQANAAALRLVATSLLLITARSCVSQGIVLASQQQLNGALELLAAVEQQTSASNAQSLAEPARSVLRTLLGHLRQSSTTLLNRSLHTTVANLRRAVTEWRPESAPSAPTLPSTEQRQTALRHTSVQGLRDLAQYLEQHAADQPPPSDLVTLVTKSESELGQSAFAAAQFMLVLGARREIANPIAPANVRQLATQIEQETSTTLRAHQGVGADFNFLMAWMPNAASRAQELVSSLRRNDLDRFVSIVSRLPTHQRVYLLDVAMRQERRTAGALFELCAEPTVRARMLSVWLAPSSMEQQTDLNGLLARHVTNNQVPPAVRLKLSNQATQHREALHRVAETLSRMGVGSDRDTRFLEASAAVDAEQVQLRQWLSNPSAANRRTYVAASIRARSLVNLYAAAEDETSQRFFATMAQAQGMAVAAVVSGVATIATLGLAAFVGSVTAVAGTSLATRAASAPVAEQLACILLGSQAGVLAGGALSVTQQALVESGVNSNQLERDVVASVPHALGGAAGAGFAGIFTRIFGASTTQMVARAVERVGGTAGQATAVAHMASGAVINVTSGMSTSELGRLVQRLMNDGAQAEQGRAPSRGAEAVRLALSGLLMGPLMQNVNRLASTRGLNTALISVTANASFATFEHALFNHLLDQRTDGTELVHTFFSALSTSAMFEHGAAHETPQALPSARELARLRASAAQAADGPSDLAWLLRQTESRSASQQAELYAAFTAGRRAAHAPAPGMEPSNARSVPDQVSARFEAQRSRLSEVQRAQLDDLVSTQALTPQEQRAAIREFLASTGSADERLSNLATFRRLLTAYLGTSAGEQREQRVNALVTANGLRSLVVAGCGATAVQMQQAARSPLYALRLRVLGEHARAQDQQIRSHTHTGLPGVNAATLQAQLQAVEPVSLFGVAPRSNREHLRTFNDAHTQLDHAMQGAAPGEASVVLLLRGEHGLGHAVLVTEIDNAGQSYRVLDPATGRQRTLSLADMRGPGSDGMVGAFVPRRASAPRNENDSWLRGLRFGGARPVVFSQPSDPRRVDGTPPSWPSDINIPQLDPAAAQRVVRAVFLRLVGLPESALRPELSEPVQAVLRSLPEQSLGTHGDAVMMHLARVLVANSQEPADAASTLAMLGHLRAAAHANLSDFQDLNNQWGLRGVLDDSTMFGGEALRAVLEAPQTARSYADARAAFASAWRRLAPSNVDAPMLFTDSGSAANSAVTTIATLVARRRAQTSDAASSEPVRQGRILFFDGVYGGGRGFASGMALGPWSRGISTRMEQNRVISPTAQEWPITNPDTIRRLEVDEHRALAQIEEQLQLTGQDTVGAILLEPIQSFNDISFYRPEFLMQVRALADRYQVPIVADEVFTGGGRTGEFFGYQHYRLPDGRAFEPDFVTFGKQVQACGIAPVRREGRARIVPTAEDAAALFGAEASLGSSIHLTQGAAVLNAIASRHLMDHAARAGRHLMARLTGRGERVHGVGLLVGMRIRPENTHVAQHGTDTASSVGVGETLRTRDPSSPVIARLIGSMTLTEGQIDSYVDRSFAPSQSTPASNAAAAVDELGITPELAFSLMTAAALGAEQSLDAGSCARLEALRARLPNVADALNGLRDVISSRSRGLSNTPALSSVIGALAGLARTSLDTPLAPDLSRPALLHALHDPARFNLDDLYFRILETGSRRSNYGPYNSPSRPLEALKRGWSEWQSHNRGGSGLNVLAMTDSRSAAFDLIPSLANQAARARLNAPNANGSVVSFSNVRPAAYGQGSAFGSNATTESAITSRHDDRIEPPVFRGETPTGAAAERLTQLENATITRLRERFADTAHPVGVLLLDALAIHRGVEQFRPEFLRRLQELCQRSGVLVVADETASSGSITGLPFAHQTSQVDGVAFSPDYVVFGEPFPAYGVAGRSDAASAGAGGGLGLTTITMEAHQALPVAADLTAINNRGLGRWVIERQPQIVDSLSRLQQHLGGGPRVEIHGSVVVFEVPAQQAERLGGLVTDPGSSNRAARVVVHLPMTFSVDDVRAWAASVSATP